MEGAVSLYRTVRVAVPYADEMRVTVVEEADAVAWGLEAEIWVALVDTARREGESQPL